MSDKPFNVVVELIDLYWDDAAAFAEDMLNFTPDAWQRAVLDDISGHSHVSVRSGQGVGKTGLEAITVIWYLCCRPNPKVICTAPTRHQLHAVLWAEIAKWLESSLVKRLLKWTATTIYMHGHKERWFATARTATKSENMQGFHEDYMLFIVDEASGVADNIMEAILGTLSGAENKLLMCGNPTKTSGVFYDSHHRDRADYKTHKVSSYDSSRASQENIERLLRKYGEDSDVARVRIFGDFPKSEPDTFIPLALVEKATMNDVYESECIDEENGEWAYIIPETAEISIGVDVARFGDDETVVVPKIGKYAPYIRTFQGQDTMETTGRVIATAKHMMREYGRPRCVVKVDDDGVGGAVTDRLNEVVSEEGLNIDVVDCHNGARARDDDHYDNWGTESWAAIRDMLQDEDIKIPDNDDLVAQLSNRKYKVTSKGKLRLESKDEMKKRGVSSPDRAEALILAFTPANEPMKAEEAELLRGLNVYG